ncbi:hypothetical protein KM043_008935 [Ampulex compressa]|nr:hypothetical protein KM043_008935 [Ampulex compressa]
MSVDDGRRSDVSVGRERDYGATLSKDRPHRRGAEREASEGRRAMARRERSGTRSRDEERKEGREGSEASGEESEGRRRREEDGKSARAMEEADYFQSAGAPPWKITFLFC